MKTDPLVSRKFGRLLIARLWTPCAPYESRGDHGLGAMCPPHVPTQLAKSTELGIDIDTGGL